MLAAALLVVVQIASVADLVNPRPDGWVTDQASVLSADAEAQLDASIAGIHAARGIEIAVVTVDSVPGTAKHFATELFNTWGIGSAQTNTGVLVLLVMDQRRLEIETGDGIEAALPAQWLADMQAASMVPRFKQKDFAGGLVAGVDAIVEHLRAAPGEGTATQAPHEYRSDGTVVDPGPAGAGAARRPATGPVPPEPGSYVAPKDPGDDGVLTGALVGGGLGLVGLGGGGALLARRRRKARMCPTCTPPIRMMLLSELEDDALLQAGQVTEEQLGSVDYEVMVCSVCQHSHTIRHNKWFSGYSTCSGCGFKTGRSSSTTTVTATYTHGGEIEVTETCASCPRVHTYTRYTPQRTLQVAAASGISSGGGGGGGGFSGGHSSGGGAGSSW